MGRSQRPPPVPHTALHPTDRLPSLEPCVAKIAPWLLLMGRALPSSELGNPGRAGQSSFTC